MTIRTVPSPEYPTFDAAYAATAPYGDTILLGASPNTRYFSIKKIVNLIVLPSVYNNNYNDWLQTDMQSTQGGSLFDLCLEEFPDTPVPMQMLIEGFHSRGPAPSFRVYTDAGFAHRTQNLELVFNRVGHRSGDSISTSDAVLQNMDSHDYLDTLNFHIKYCESGEFWDVDQYSSRSANSHLIVEKCIFTAGDPNLKDGGSTLYQATDFVTSQTAGYGAGNPATGEMYGTALGEQFVNDAFWSVSGVIQNIPVEVDTADFKVLLFREHPTISNLPIGPMEVTNINPDGTWEFTLLDPSNRYGVLINPPDGMKGHWLKWYNPAGG